MTERALSPVIGTVLLLVVTLLVAGAASASLLGMASLEEPSQPISISATADAQTNTITLVHQAGPPLDVRDLEIKILIDGLPLFHQPPVPFVGARGFRGAPSGPFNAAADPKWIAGESGSFRIARKNVPSIDPGSVIKIKLYYNNKRLALIEFNN